MADPSLLKEITTSQSLQQLLLKIEKIVLARSYWGISTDDVRNTQIPNNLELREGELCIPATYIGPAYGCQDTNLMRNTRNIHGHINLLRQVYDDEFGCGFQRDHLKTDENNLVVNTAPYNRGVRFIVLDLLNRSSDLKEEYYWAGTEIFDAVILYKDLLMTMGSLFVPAFAFGHGADSRQILLSTYQSFDSPYVCVNGIHWANGSGQFAQPVFRNVRPEEY
jgi:hypothetical protein